MVIIIELMGYNLAGSVVVHLVATKVRHDLAHAYDELVRNTVELDA